jgi:hypothetical protein
MAYEVIALTAAQIQQKIQDSLTLAIRELDGRRDIGYLTALEKKVTLIDRATNKLLGLGLNKREARKVVDQAKMNGDRPSWKAKVM